MKEIQLKEGQAPMTGDEKSAEYTVDISDSKSAPFFFPFCLHQNKVQGISINLHMKEYTNIFAVQAVSPRVDLRRHVYSR